MTAIPYVLIGLLLLAIIIVGYNVYKFNRIRKNNKYVFIYRSVAVKEFTGVYNIDGDLIATTLENCGIFGNVYSNTVYLAKPDPLFDNTYNIIGGVGTCTTDVLTLPSVKWRQHWYEELQYKVYEDRLEVK